MNNMEKLKSDIDKQGKKAVLNNEEAGGGPDEEPVDQY